MADPEGMALSPHAERKQAAQGSSTSGKIGFEAVGNSGAKTAGRTHEGQGHSFGAQAVP